MNKKILISFVVCLIMLVGVNSFAGSFYANITLVGAKKSDVVELLKNSECDYYITDTLNNKIVIYDNQSEMNPEFGLRLSWEISKKLNCITIFSAVYDSDLLKIKAFNNGKKLFYYNSDPGLDSGMESNPVIKDVEQFLKALNCPEKQLALEVILNDTSEKYIFEDERHTDIVNMLGLPAFSAGLGYNYINADSDVLKNFEKEYGVRVKRK